MIRHIRLDLHHFGALALAMFMWAIPLASDAAVQAQVDRSTVAPGESLTLEISGTSNAQPDLSPLAKDFVVQGTGQQSNTNIVNGQMSQSMSWQIHLQPRHGGSLLIPPLAVGKDHTNALFVTVAQPSRSELAQAAQHVFMEIDAGEASGHSVVLQQQIPYTVRLFYDDSIQNGEISPPKPENATVQQLGEDLKYSASRHGHDYQVLERHYAIAPERSGLLEIQPARFQGTMLVAQAPNQGGDSASIAGDTSFADMMRNTPFANDPMFRDAFRGMGAMNSMGTDTRLVSAEGQAVSVHVEPRPASATGNWLPAEQISLSDSWQDRPPQFRAGEPVSRTITIQAKGLAAAQIPPLTFPAPGNARVYTETPDSQSRTDGQTIYGISKQTVTYIPSASGTLVVPAIALDWWNTQTHIASRSELPAQSFDIAPGLPSSAPRAVGLVTPASTGAALLGAGTEGATGVKSARQDLRRFKDWGWAGLLTVGGGLLIAWLLRSKTLRQIGEITQASETGTPSSSSVAAPPKKRASLRALGQACRINDRHAAALALLDLARAEWPTDPPRGLSALAARIDMGGPEISALDRNLYGADDATGQWRGEALWRVMARGLRPKSPSPTAEATGLSRLYR